MYGTIIFYCSIDYHDPLILRNHLILKSDTDVDFPARVTCQKCLPAFILRHVNILHTPTTTQLVKT